MRVGAGTNGRDGANPSGAVARVAAPATEPIVIGEAFREALGDEAFFAALSAYFGETAFGIAQPDDLLNAFETASGQDLQDLWNEWFRETSGD